METAQKPAGATATNQRSQPIQDRHSGLYHDPMGSSQEIPSWVRKGHTRKPNRVVRAIYVIFDLIADFGPMVSWIFRLFKKTVVGTWGLLARFFLGTVNIAILAGILFVSVGHSHDMLIRAGMSGIAAWVFVGVWETVFVYCGTVIDNAYRKGKEPGWAAWTGFGMGWIFVEVSNVMGMGSNWLGRAIGLSTPVLLLVMKKVFQKQFGKDSKAKAKTKRSSWFFSNQKDAKADTGQTDTGDTQQIDQSFVKEIPAQAPIVEKRIREEDKDSVQEHERGVQKKELEAPITYSVSSENKKMAKEAKSETKQKKEKKEPITLSDKRLEKERVREIGRSMWKEEGEPPGRKRLKDRADCGDNMAKNVAAELKKEYVKEVAHGIWSDTGSLPGVEQLKKEAKCSINVAKSVLAELEGKAKRKVG